ncbi:ABC transporter ATP-binding protein [Natronospora cellulosivora (SeqCode)]
MVNLKIEKLYFKYGKHSILEDINLSVKEGEIFCLAGSNGAGKTTLLKCINRLLIPKKGKIYINERNIKNLSGRELAQELAYVSQANKEKFPASVFDSILLGRRPYIKWKPTARDFDIVSSLIKKLELEKFSDKDIRELSGGERQKVLIARALAQDTNILLLDEPGNHLDLKHQLELMELLKELVEEKRITVIITTHDLNLAARYCDKIAMLEAGKIHALGNVDIINSANIRNVYHVNAEIKEEAGKPYVIPLNSISRAKNNTMEG